MEKSLSVKNFSDRKRNQFALTPEEALRVVTPEIYENALKHFLSSWRRSLSEQIDTNEGEHVENILSLEKALISPQLFEESVWHRISVIELPKDFLNHPDNKEGNTHLIVYGLQGIKYPFKKDEKN